MFLQFIPSVLKFYDLKTLAAGGFLVSSSTDTHYRTNILFISVSAWYRSGSEQQDRRKD